MKKSLSIVMPIHNAQSTLTQEVERLLDMISDMGIDFELLIVDDGSTDGTEEVLYELCCQYPQVRSRRYTPKQGKATAIDLGLAASLGEVVMIQDQESQLTTEDIRSLWAMHQDAMAAKAQMPTREVMQQSTPFVPADPQPLGADLLSRLSKWGADVSELQRAGEDPWAAIETKNKRTDKEQDKQDTVQPPAPKIAMPQFLRQLTEFAVSE